MAVVDHCVQLVCGSSFVKVPGKLVTRDVWRVPQREGRVLQADNLEVAWVKTRT